MKTVTINHFATGDKSVLVDGGHAEAYMRQGSRLIGFVRSGELIECSQSMIQGTPGDRWITFEGEKIPVKGY